MFVYGTLLRGGALELVYFDPHAERTPAVLPNYRLHYARHTKQYPVAVPGLGDDDCAVIGELVYADRSDIAAALRMEAHAGYTIEIVKVAREPGTLANVEAVAALWPDRRVGARIPSGDWRNR